MNGPGQFRHLVGLPSATMEDTDTMVAASDPPIDQPAGLPEVRVRADGQGIAWRTPDCDRWTVQGINGNRMFMAFGRDADVPDGEWLPMTADVQMILSGEEPAPLTAELLRAYAKDAIIDRLGYWRATTIRELIADDDGGLTIVLNSGGNMLAVAGALAVAGVAHEMAGEPGRPAISIPPGQVLRW